ncbi:MAG TPA: ankyrin repeat domain-containing protein [Steroidobacteraceae bacterium]|nr:ankyrin repeat domain-containing protein [Steroidobacteraceae bacterium]
MLAGKKKKMVVGALLAIAALWGIHYFTVTRFTKLTPLMVAARAGYAPMVESELRRGANPDRVWNDGSFRIHGTARTGVTPLLFSLEQAGPGVASHAPVVKLLLAAGADPCATDNLGATPLLMAVEKGDVEAVRALWEGGPAPCVRARSREALQVGYLRLSQGPDDDANWTLIEYLIDDVAQPGDADHPGFLVASALPGAHAALERLIARGVKADGQSLFFAAVQGKADLIPWLVEHGANVNEPVPEINDETGPPLVRAAANPDPASMRALLDAGADVDAVDVAGRTALTRLVCETSCTRRPHPFCEKQLDAARLLLERGAHRTGKDRFGHDLAACLRDRPADPYRPDFEALLGTPASAN